MKELMKEYRGTRLLGNQVTVKDGSGVRWLPPRRDLRNYDAHGFDWGCHGDGASQLSLAILADSLGDDVAVKWHQEFKAAVIAKMQGWSWILTEEQVVAALEDLRRNSAGIAQG